MTRMRPACARRPDAAIVSVFKKSIVALLPAHGRLALAERSLDEIKTARVERRRCLEVHLVGSNLHHLFLEVHGIPGGANLEGARTAVSVRRLAQADTLDMAIRRAHERNGYERPGSSERGFVELQRREIARMELRRVGIRYVLCKHPLPRLSPIEAGAKHGQYRNVANSHRQLPQKPPSQRCR